MYGICTLANDHVLDQAIALINSIEAIMGSEFPVCIFPYDDRIEKLTAAIADRPNVQIFQDQSLIEYWENESKKIWDTHPAVQQRWNFDPKAQNYYRLGMHRRFVAFSAPFDRFIYMDADTLLLNDVTPIFDKLDDHDWVIYDFQYKDPQHVFDVESPQFQQVFSTEYMQSKMFCAGFYASKRNVFPQDSLDRMLSAMQAGEAGLLFCMSPDQAIVNYWVMKAGLSVYNFALELPEAERTGCCVTSPQFEMRDNLLYDRGNRLTYLHYIGISSTVLSKICQGENLKCPYRDIFLHYRYLREPEAKPMFYGTPKPFKSPKNTVMNRVLRKLSRTLNMGH
jgi:hypothetical protein